MLEFIIIFVFSAQRLILGFIEFLDNVSGNENENELIEKELKKRE